MRKRICRNTLASLLPVTAVALGFLFSVPAFAASRLNIVAATTDLAALAEEVGGDRIDVESIARGYQDPHFV